MYFHAPCKIDRVNAAANSDPDKIPIAGHFRRYTDVRVRNKPDPTFEELMEDHRLIDRLEVIEEGSRRRRRRRRRRNWKEG